MSFKPVNRVTKVINKDTVKDGYLYNENEYHISSKPIYYQNTAGSFHDIDITYSQSLNNSKVGDFVSYNKDVSSFGIRKDGNTTKYIGIRPDNTQELGSQQMEWTIEDININGNNITPNLSEYTQEIITMNNTDFNKVIVNLGNVKVENTKQHKRQMIHYTGSIDNFKIEYKMHLTGLDIYNPKYSSNTTIRNEFSASIIDCGTINPDNYNSQISLQETSQSILSMYIDGDLFSLNVSASNEFYDTSSYTIINRDKDFWGIDDFIDGASSGYHGKGLWMRFVDDNTALYTARKLEKILNIELEKNIDETDDTIYFRNKTGNKGKVGGWGRVQNGKNSYIGISLNDFSHLSSSFVSKSFDDVSYVTMSYSDIMTNLQNNLESFEAVTVDNNYYEPLTLANDIFIIKDSNEHKYGISKPKLLDSDYNEVITDTLHTLKDNGDGTYEYIKYPDLKAIANGISGSVENIDVDIQQTNNYSDVWMQETNSFWTTGKKANPCDYLSWTATSMLYGTGNDYTAPKLFFCFMPDQLINMADGSKKPIGLIELGDIVQVFDEETMSVKLAPVEKINIKEHDDVYKLHIGNKILKPTGNHPFLTKNKGWTTIDGHNPNHAGGKGYLKEGDFVYDINDGWIEVTKIEAFEGSYNTYNFVDMDYGTIIADDIVSHNSGTNTKTLRRGYMKFNTSGVTATVTSAKFKGTIDSMTCNTGLDAHKHIFLCKSNATGSAGAVWLKNDWNTVDSSSNGMYYHGNEDGAPTSTGEHELDLRAAARNDIQNDDVFRIVATCGYDINHSASSGHSGNDNHDGGRLIAANALDGTSNDPTLIVTTTGTGVVASVQNRLHLQDSQIVIEDSQLIIE